MPPASLQSFHHCLIVGIILMRLLEFKSGLTNLNFGKDKFLVYQKGEMFIIYFHVGALSRLQRRLPDGSLGPSWASRQHPLAELIYSTYTEKDYDVIWTEYTYLSTMQPWFFHDFGNTFP